MRETILLLILFVAGSIHLSAQNCAQNLQHLSDIPATCNEMTMTMQADRLSRPYLYTAAKEGGLLVHEITDPTNPLLEAQVPIASLGGLHVMNVTQAGNYLYLALGNHFLNGDNPGMAIIDVTDPQQPAVMDVWTYPTPEGGSGIVQVSGDYAYLGAMEHGLIILDISNKQAIAQVSQYIPDINYPDPNPDPAKYNARGMVVADDLVYLCYDAGGLRTIDVSNKLQPQEIGWYSNPAVTGKPRAYNNIALAGDLVYIAVDYCGMEILDVSDPQDIKLKSWWNPWNCETSPLNWFSSPGHANEIAYHEAGKLVFLSAGKSDLLVVDVSDVDALDSCAYYGGIDNNIGTWGVSVFEDHIYLAYICAVLPFASNWTGVKILGWDPPTAVDSSPNQEPVKVYPNPFQEQIRVDLNEWQTGQRISMQLMDQWGRTLLSQQTSSGASDLLLDTKNLPSGTYVLLVQSEHDVARNLMVKY